MVAEKVAIDTIAAKLGSWAARCRYSDLPCAVRAKTHDSVVDTIGVALAGFEHPAGAAVRRVVDDLGGHAQADVIGHGSRTSGVHAAFANAYLAHVLDFDDTLHTGAIAHVSAPVLTAALAGAQVARGTGEDFLAAHAAGMEVTSRIAVAMSGRADHGWHITGVAGTLGAAAAAARAMGLTVDETIHALGASSTMTAGLRVHRGTGTKSLSPAHAASSGVLAAVSARAGMSSNTAFFEHATHGFLASYGFPTDPRSVVDGLGSEYAMLDVEPKPYPCGVTAHAAIDAALDLASDKTNGLDGEAIDEVAVRVHPLALELTGNIRPETGLESKFSLTHAVAIALIDREVTPRSFTDSAVVRADVANLRRRFSVSADPAMSRHRAAINVVTESGRTLSRTSTARGTSARPITSADIERKFLQLNRSAWGEDRCASILRIVSGLEGAGSLDSLGSALGKPPTSRAG